MTNRRIIITVAAVTVATFFGNYAIDSANVEDDAVGEPLNVITFFASSLGILALLTIGAVAGVRALRR